MVYFLEELSNRTEFSVLQKLTECETVSADNLTCSGNLIIPGFAYKKLPADTKTRINVWFETASHHSIKEFWQTYKERIYPFEPDGVKLVSVGTKRFGAIIFALEGENIQYIPDILDKGIIAQLTASEHMQKLKSVGIKRLLHGVLGKSARTAAYQFDGISPNNRLEPSELREYGLINMHVKAGYNTSPLLVEMLGTVNDWTTTMLDSIAEHIISLIPFDQDKALPLPLWYAKHSLQPIRKGNVLQYFKVQSRDMLKREALDNIWKADFDIFEE